MIPDDNSSSNDLDEELDNYEFNNGSNSLTEQDRIYIKNLYFMMKSAFQNKIFIENYYDCNLRIKDNIISVFSKNNNKDINNNVSHKSTLFFSNFKNVTIVINTKVAHITLEKCRDVNIKIIGGSITGLDFIRCVNLSCVFDKGFVYFVDISNSEECNMYFSFPIALSTMITTMFSYKINFYILSPANKVHKTFKKNTSYFDIYKKYVFENNYPDTIIKEII